jgi:hypothetical protein
MGILSWFVGGPRKSGPTRDALMEASRQSWLASDMTAVLLALDEDHVLPDTADVAAGTRGYSLHALERAGLMKIERVARDSPLAPGAWRFTPTARARAQSATRAAASTPLS